MVSGIPLLFVILAAILLVVFLTARLKFHPFLALVIACFFLGIATRMPLSKIVVAMGEGFGGLMQSIGMIVIFGSVIGVFLERSGGALQIARTIIKLSSEKRTLSAISLIGAVVSVPVFCDSGFILLSGLSDTLSKLSKQNKAGLSLALATGLYTTHTLIPPTPGPIAAAGNIGASEYLGTIILLGIGISVPILLLSQFFSKRLGKNIIAEAVVVKEETLENLPGIFNALLPLLLPIVLIAMGTILKFVGVEIPWVAFISNPLVSIFIGAIMAMFLLKPKENEKYQDWFVEAIKVAGPILIITAAGGAFGSVLKATSLSGFVGQWIGNGSASSFTVLLIIFAIAAVLKTAQGSSTGAMVITSSLLAPLIPTLGWTTPLQFALAVMAIGGGAMMVSHYNDSYFWVVSQFSGMTAKDTNKSFSLLTIIQGVSVLFLVLLIWSIAI
ncbi:MAG: GntP family permease [Saonia sp.]